MARRVRALWRANWAIGLILFAFIVLGVTYSLVTPIFEAPDEIQHYFYVKYLADERTLPVLTIPEGEIFQQEGSQPPLYYLLGALATFWIDTDDALSLLNPNPYANVGIPLALGNKNVIIHTTREAFPFHGAVLAIHLVRFLSVLLGAVTALSTYLLAREIFPQDKALALGAACINAFVPQFLFISGAVNNDGAVTAASSVVLLLVVRFMKAKPNWKGYLGLGLALGLAALTKLSGLGLIAVALAGLLIVTVKRRSPRVWIEGGAVILLSVLLIAGWWYLRNWSLYRDPTALNMHLAIMGTRERPLTLSRFLYEMRGFKTSFWALFGWFNVPAGSVIYRFFDLLTLAALLGLIWAIIKGLRGKDRSSLPYLTPLLLWLLILAVNFYSWTAKTPATQGRLAFPAISVISLLLFWGLSQFVPRRHTKFLAAVLGSTLLLIAAVSPFRYIAPAYARPLSLSKEELGSISHRLEVNYEGEVRLLGYDIKERVIRPGEFLHFTLYWQSLKVMEQDYTVYLKLLGPENEVIGQIDTYPGLGSYPTTLWHEGEITKDTYALGIERPVEPPFAALIEVGLYERETMRGLAAYGGEGQAVDRVIIGRVKVAPRRLREYLIPNPVYFDLDNKVALVGYEIDPLMVKAGGSLHLILYWQAQQEMYRDYTVFTHLIDEEGKIWAQKDNQPLGGNYPTSLWDEGEVVRDDYELIVRPDVSPGEYRLEVGMYLAEIGDRLPVSSAEGEFLGDRILLPSAIEVTP
ncbi:MAG: glycosyltransferase family 39 protein [Anaerolineae bacterium]|nr:glycosyltransferase family 39 protein [Anaerolineae bacterium]